MWILPPFLIVALEQYILTGALRTFTSQEEGKGGGSSGEASALLKGEVKMIQSSLQFKQPTEE